LGLLHHYYHGDHLGSSRFLSSYNGTPMWEATYLPFGQEHAPGGAPPPAPGGQHYKFTGKERDVESGLDYMGARYYTSLTGRFISPDLPGMDQHLTNPQSWNLYAYARNNPLAFTDPTGRWAKAEHDDIIDYAFNTILSSNQRSVLKSASEDVDKDQSLGGSSKHGMRVI
jgi:RHS repeat-associated protein